MRRIFFPGLACIALIMTAAAGCTPKNEAVRTTAAGVSSAPVAPAEAIKNVPPEQQAAAQQDMARVKADAERQAREGAARAGQTPK